MIGIYKITSPSNKIYIGQSVNIEKRFTTYKRLDCKNQNILYKSLIKYGVENHIFEILQECSIELLNERERYYQDLFLIKNKTLNCKLTNTNDKSGVLSDETKLKISLSNKGKKRSQEHKDILRLMRLGSKMSNDTKLKISKANLGKVGAMLNKKHSEETKDLIKINNCKYWIGKERSFETKNKISKKLIGRKFCELTKKNMSINNAKYWLGKSLSQEHKEKIKNSKIGKPANNCKILIDLETGIFYNSVREASKLYNIKETTLIMQLKGVNKNKTNLRYV
jgi:group I intron endonuclease